jgi:hypothetical protein
MKNISRIGLILTLLLFGCTYTYAQSISLDDIDISEYSINGIPIPEYTNEYVQIIGEFGSVSFSVQIDFGHSAKTKERKVEDKSGKKVEFKSMIEALNFMNLYGYEYIDSYSGTGKDVATYFYVLRKKK